jgi:hypothetical protein
MVHLGTVALVLAFLGLAWWQIDRARDGNALSFGYAVEWPAFAIFVLYVWRKEVRATLARADAAADDGSASTVPASPEPNPAVNVTAGTSTEHRPGRAPAPREVLRGRALPEAAFDDSDDPDLAAYNKYLAWLTENPQASRSQYPG